MLQIKLSCSRESLVVEVKDGGRVESWWVAGQTDELIGGHVAQCDWERK